MPTKIIFDTDPGVDDAAALLFLNACRTVDLVGITTIFGNADIDTVTRNAL
ncbi:nucleoside hydrolase, partial [Rhizobiaceae sp. 2RAB30]